MNWQNWRLYPKHPKYSIYIPILAFKYPVSMQTCIYAIYIQDVISINDTLLEAECNRAKMTHEHDNIMYPKMYPNLQKCIQLSATIPVNTAEVERGFSCMNRIISYVRNSLTERASDLMLLSLNKDLLLNVDINAFIDRFARKRNRYIPLH